jgi:protein involved in polysaccharide export with SLBB domain
LANTYEVGDRVKVTVDDLPYAGTIITYDDTTYQVSVDGLGRVVKLEEEDIDPLSGG